MKRKFRQWLSLLLCAGILMTLFQNMPPLRAEAAALLASVRNPSFEKGLAGWNTSIANPTAGTSSVETASNIVLGGSYSLKMSGPGAGDGSHSGNWLDVPCCDQYDIPVDGGKTYVFKAWVWTDMASGDGPMLIAFGDVVGSWVCSSNVLANGSPAMWKQIEFYFTATATASTVSIGIRFFGNGSAWFDEVTLQSLESNTVYATSFEDLMGENNPPASVNTAWNYPTPVNTTADLSWNNPVSTGNTWFYGAKLGVAHTGNASLCIVQHMEQWLGGGGGPQQVYDWYYFRIKGVTAGQYIEPSVWARTDGYLPGQEYFDNGAYLVMQFYDSDGVKLGSDVTSASTNSGVWTYLEAGATAPAGTYYIELLLCAKGKVSAYFDDLNVRTLAPLMKAMLKNGDFSEGSYPPDNWAVTGGPCESRLGTNPYTGGTHITTYSHVPESGGFPLRTYSQAVDVRAGETYVASVWANIGGSGGTATVTIKIDWLNAAGSVISSTGPGVKNNTIGWSKITTGGTAPGGCAKARVVVLAQPSSGKYIDLDNAVLNRTVGGIAFVDDITLTVQPGSVINGNFFGFGAHGDYTLNCSQNSSMTPEDIALFREKVEEVRPQIMRIFLAYQWWTDGYGNYYTDLASAPPELRDVVEWISFLKDIGTAVHICPWGDYFGYPDVWRDWNPPPATDGKKLPKPQYRWDMINSYVAFLDFLINGLGLDNVKYYTLACEPDNSGTGNNPTARELDTWSNALTAAINMNPNLFGKLHCVGIDACALPFDGVQTYPNPGVDVNAYDANTFGAITWLWENMESLGLNWADSVAFHTYNHGLFGIENLSAVVQYARNHSLGKPVWIAEFGDFRGEVMPDSLNMPGTVPVNHVYQSATNHRYDFGLWMGDFTITALKAGIGALLHWYLADLYIDNPYTKAEYGLWKAGDADSVNRPGYYIWSLINRYTKANSQVVNVALSDDAEGALDAVAMIAPDGKVTVFIRNESYRSITLDVTPMGRAADFDVYVYEAAAVPKNESSADLIERSSTLYTHYVNTKVTIPPKSFTVLTEISYLDDTPRVPNLDIGSRQPIYADEGINASYSGAGLGSVYFYGLISPGADFDDFKYVELDLYVNDTALLPAGGLNLFLYEYDNGDVLKDAYSLTLGNRWNKLRFPVDPNAEGTCYKWVVYGNPGDADLRLWAANFCLAKDPDPPLLDVGIRCILDEFNQKIVYDAHGSAVDISGPIGAIDLSAGEFLEFDLYVNDDGLLDQGFLDFYLWDDVAPGNSVIRNMPALKTGWNHARFNVSDANGDFAQWKLYGGAGQEGLTLIFANFVLTKNPELPPPDINATTGSRTIIQQAGPNTAGWNSIVQQFGLDGSTVLYDCFADAAPLSIFCFLANAVDCTQPGVQYVEFDLFVSDPARFSSLGMDAYLRKMATAWSVNDMYFHMPTSMQQGWNHIKFAYASGIPGAGGNMAAIDVLAFYMGSGKANLLLGIANFCITQD